MYERFERSARQAIDNATAEAARTGQDKVRSEHLLLGLLTEPGTAADVLLAAGITAEDLRTRIIRGGAQPDDLDADALASLGIDLDAVRRATDAAFGPGALDLARVPGRKRLPFADDSKQSLASAARYVVRNKQRYITSGHLLIGIIDQPRGGALAVLADAGADIAALRADVLRRIVEAA